VFATCFGRKHIGAISSFNRSVQIIGTSVGPVSLALVRDAFGPGTVVCLLFCSAVLLQRFAPAVLRCRSSHHSETAFADGLRSLNLYFMLPSLLLSLVSLRQSSASHHPLSIPFSMLT